MEILLATFTALFSVMNPFGAIPVFLALTQDLEPAQRNQQALKTALNVIGILVVFFFAGTFILNFFGIRIEDIRIAGGIMIIRAGFNLLEPDAYKKGRVSKSVEEEGISKADISFTPMAMPILSGPGAIAVTIGLFNKMNGRIEYFYTITAIVLLATACYLTLRFSDRLLKFMGQGGLSAMTKIMGFLVLSVGISMIVNGVLPLLQQVFPH